MAKSNHVFAEKVASYITEFEKRQKAFCERVDHLEAQLEQRVEDLRQAKEAEHRLLDRMEALYQENLSLQASQKKDAKEQMDELRGAINDLRRGDSSTSSSASPTVGFGIFDGQQPGEIAFSPPSKDNANTQPRT
jgi:hypothetical protein